MTVTLKMCILDAKLVKPSLNAFGRPKFIYLKIVESNFDLQNHFGFTNMGSNMNIFQVTATLASSI